MNYSDLSDLEEGEIFEYDSLSPYDSRSEDFEFRKSTFESFKKEKDTKKRSHGLEKDEDIYFFQHNNKDGYVNEKLKEKLQLSNKVGDVKSSVGDLESISSEGEYKSDEEGKLSANETGYYMCSNSENKNREKHSTHFYGTVKDIMCEIGERLCRKSRCNYKKRKSKKIKHNLEKYSDSSCDLWSSKIFSSHLKYKKYKKKVSFYSSDSDRADKRKKKKKRHIYYEETEKPAEKLKLRDFDEVRRSLLEKLKQQKAEEEIKALNEDPPIEIDNSDIQEVDMLIDCTNYVDNPVREDSCNERRESDEKEGEDELDLIELRLIALASKKKRKSEDSGTQTEKIEDVPAEKNCYEEGRKDVELDKSELLLRTEALKTAFLKKHQKRLKNKKIEKLIETGNSSGNDEVNSSLIPQTEEKNSEKGDAKLDACKENPEKESEIEAANSYDDSSAQVFLLNTRKETEFVTNANPKKMHPRGKSKRKKRKSVSLANSLKENNEKSDTLEEDDRTLRTQLLTDLMKKKSLKSVEKKPILMDSVQTSTNKPERPKDTEKPFPVPKKHITKKMNVAKPGKLTTVHAFPKPEIQRIIVHLGSDDSSDEDVCVPLEDKDDQISAQEKESVNVSGKDKQTKEVTEAEYEKSVELLLSQARKKIEKEKRTVPDPVAMPEAVHKPPSQSKIPNLKKQKKGTPTLPQPLKTSVSHHLKLGNIKPMSSSSSNISLLKNNSILSKLVRNSNIKNSRLYTDLNRMKRKEASRGSVINKVNNSPGFSGKDSKKYVAPQIAKGPAKPSAATTTTIERNTLLLLSGQALISKLKLLKKIKTIEENYEKEILKLKNQLSLFEKKKCEQRHKRKKLGEESVKTFKANQGITAELKESAGEGKKNDGDDEERSKNEKEQKTAEIEEKEEGKKMSDEPETETSKAQSETDKELSNDNKISEILANGTSSGSRLLKYDSPLQTFSEASDLSKRVDPNVMMCQFDLMGVCKDEECTYQHLRVS